MTGLSRRGLLQASGTLAVTSLAARADADIPGIAVTGELVPLWPGRPPGSPATPPYLKIDDQSHDPAHPDRWISGVATPHLVVCRAARPNGAAVLLIPGGGYGFLSYDNEGTSQARWLNALGVTAFILLYRLPKEGWADRAEVPLQDAQRAMRLIRANSARYGIDPQRVAAIGFSAGGHLAGSLATMHDATVYGNIDAADGQSARPDLVGMIYPVVSFATPFTHGDSRDSLLGPGSSEGERERWSIERLVTADTPALFLVHASDDGLVPVQNSIALYQAVLGTRRPGELHVFDEGGHGFGVRANPAFSVAAWPQLFTRYAARRGIFPRAAA